MVIVIHCYQFLRVPATLSPIERVFSYGGNILKPERPHLLPKNFEDLFVLKMNSIECLCCTVMCMSMNILIYNYVYYI